MVTATNRVLITGGVLLLLPFLTYSYDPNKGAGFQFRYGLTDNIYQLNIKDAGQIVSLSPFAFCEGSLELNYGGDISLINFDANNLLLANDIRVTKTVLLPGIGNKTAFYADLYSFHAPSYEQYRVVNITAGNSLHAYLGNHLLSTETKVLFKHYPLDSLNDYLEPKITLGIGIPLPYVVFTPTVGFGFRSHQGEFVPLYTARSEFYLPLTLDFSALFELSFMHATRPQHDYIIPLEYVDDPFFEAENINQLFELQISATRTLARNRVFVETRLALYSKEFYEIENLERRDGGLHILVQLTKLFTDNFALHLNGHSRFNASTIDDFDYMKNGIELSLELIF
jgi:hypothetical protein